MTPKPKKMKTKAPGKAWSGRFTQGPDPRAEAYSSSLAVDIRLLPYDIIGSQAHVEMLGRQKILRRTEARKIQQGLQKILQEWEKGSIKITSQDEDVHMLVERRLYEIIGSVAGKMHTARSRNDQVLTDVKLYLQDECEEIIQGLRTIQKVFLKLAEKHMGWVMPGYTHMQVAQPVLVSHWLLAHLEALVRDETRFTRLLFGSLDELPLGSAALAGTTHPIDRQQVAKYLGFSRVTANSMDTVGDRDFCLEFLNAAAICAIHTSRLAEEIVWFSSSEYQFITLNQGFSTGSSIMPQKRNPDIAELIRGRSGKIVGNLVTLLTVLKGLPMTYNRDLQEDKEPIFNTSDILIQTFIVLAPMLESMRLNQEAMQSACQHGFPTATEAADHLVAQGVPFREAHAVVGRAVTYAAQEGLQLEQLSLAKWRNFHPQFQAGILQVVRLQNSIERKKSLGGTASSRVKAALKKVRNRLFTAKKAKKGK
ncbi:argininosuccinate lyase [bacterium]|nr:argininosuccinate lyase [bacterium]